MKTRDLKRTLYKRVRKKWLKIMLYVDIEERKPIKELVYGDKVGQIKILHALCVRRKHLLGILKPSRRICLGRSLPLDSMGTLQPAIS